MSWFDELRKKTARRLLVPAVAIGATISLATYEFAKPASASAPTPAPAAAALDDSSVSALLALDHAMETVAARVTPAIVNVTVTSKTSPDNGDASAHVGVRVGERHALRSVHQHEQSRGNQLALADHHDHFQKHEHDGQENSQP